MEKATDVNQIRVREIIETTIVELMAVGYSRSVEDAQRFIIEQVAHIDLRSKDNPKGQIRGRRDPN